MMHAQPPIYPPHFGAPPTMPIYYPVFIPVPVKESNNATPENQTENKKPSDKSLKKKLLKEKQEEEIKCRVEEATKHFKEELIRALIKTFKDYEMTQSSAKKLLEESDWKLEIAIQQFIAKKQQEKEKEKQAKKERKSSKQSLPRKKEKTVKSKKKIHLLKYLTKLLHLQA